MLPEELELRGLERQFPTPQTVLDRTKARRWVLTRAKKGGNGAEIGVFRGHFSAALLEVLQPAKLYLIDPWTKLGKYYPYKGAYWGHGKLSTGAALREAQLRVRRFQTTDIRFIEGFFLEVLESIEEKLDWIYLDASHKYQETLAELKGASRILSTDGVILGDDWVPNPLAPNHGVFRAVQEFTRMSDYQIVVAGGAQQYCLGRAPKYADAAVDPGLA